MESAYHSVATSSGPRRNSKSGHVAAAAKINPPAGSSSSTPRKRISLGVTMKWSKKSTSDLLALVKANPVWRHTFFSSDSARLPMWREARDLLCLLCRKQEHALMLRMRHYGLVENRGPAPGGGIIWEPTSKWNRADLVTNRAESQLRRLRDEHQQVQKEYRISDSVSSWADIKKEIRTSLRDSYPFFMEVHNLRKSDHSLSELPAPPIEDDARRDHQAGPSQSKSIPKKRPRAISVSSSSPEPIPTSHKESLDLGKRVKLERTDNSSTPPTPEAIDNDAGVSARMSVEPRMHTAPAPVISRSSSSEPDSTGSSSDTDSEVEMIPGWDRTEPGSSAAKLTAFRSTEAARGAIDVPDEELHEAEIAETDIDDDVSSPSAIESEFEVEVKAENLACGAKIDLGAERIPSVPRIDGGDRPPARNGARQQNQQPTKKSGKDVSPKEVRRLRDLKSGIERGRKGYSRISPDYSIPQNAAQMAMVAFARRAEEAPHSRKDIELYLYAQDRMQLWQSHLESLHDIARHNAAAVWTLFAGPRGVHAALSEVASARRITLAGNLISKDIELFRAFRRSLQVRNLLDRGPPGTKPRLMIHGVSAFRGHDVDLMLVDECSLYEFWRAVDIKAQPGQEAHRRRVGAARQAAKRAKKDRKEKAKEAAANGKQKRKPRKKS